MLREQARVREPKEPQKRQNERGGEEEGGCSSKDRRKRRRKVKLNYNSRLCVDIYFQIFSKKKILYMSKIFLCEGV